MELHPNKIKIGNLYKIKINVGDGIFWECAYSYTVDISNAKIGKEVHLTNKSSPIFLFLKQYEKNNFDDTILKVLIENKVIFLLVDEKKCKFEEIQ